MIIDLQHFSLTIKITGEINMRKNIKRIETLYRAIMDVPEQLHISVKKEILEIVSCSASIGIIFVVIYLLSYLLS